MQKTFMSPLKKFFLSLLIGSALGLLFTGYMVQGQFTEPNTNPPGGADPASPLTSSDIEQTKGGPLIVNFSALPGSNETGLRVVGYLQVGITPDGVDGFPDALDCDTTTPHSDDERGRMILDPIDFSTGTPILYVCSDSGWVKKEL